VRRVLAIESATDFLSVALLEDESLVGTRVSGERSQHTASLLPALDALLEESRIGLDAIDALAVSSGPGSFTSLRIGLASVKGLALSRDLPAIGVSTLEAMALAVLEGEGEGKGGGDGASVDDVARPGRSGEGGGVVALLDARRGEWYAGGWSRATERGGLPRPTLAEGLYAPTRIADAISADVILVSPEASERLGVFGEAGLSAVQVVSGASGRPRAEWVGRLAQRRLARGEGGSAERLVARYLRRAEAEAKRVGSPVERGVAVGLDRSKPRA